MIATETYEINGTSYTHTWSTEGRYVVRDGVAYEDAVDPTWCGRTYIEGDPIVNEDDEGEANAEEIVEILLGERK